MENINLCISCFKNIGNATVCPYCGAEQKTKPKEAFHLYPKTILKNRYYIGEVIGYGGFGVTYKALDMRLNETVAIKEYFPAGFVNRVPGETEVIKFPGEKGERFEEGKEKFLNEARNTAKFSDNPNIVNVYDFFEANNTAYMVMEYLEGILLKDYIRQNGGKLDVKTSLEIINKVLDGLKEVHKAGIIHRDISPDNIMLTTDNKVKLFDFGAARFSSTEQESTYSIIIKQGYAPPEQYRSKSKQGPYTDIYAVGAMLYSMLTGKIPEESVDRQIEDTLPLPSELDPTLPKYLDSVVMKALSLKSELRFQNTEQFKEALNGNRAVLMPAEELKKRQKKRSIAFAVIGAVIAVCICVGSVFKIVTDDIDLNHYIKEDAVVEMWVPVSDDTEKSEKQKSIYDEIYKEFAQQLTSDEGHKPLDAEINVNITYIPESEYAQAIADAEEDKTIPDIFRSDLLDDDVKNEISCEQVDWIKQKIIKEDYVLYDNDFSPYGLPISVDAATMYINKKYDTDNILSGASSVDSITSKADSLKNGIIPIVINPDCNIFDSDKEKIIAANGVADGNAFELFSDGKAACYIGKISELPKIKESSLSWYELEYPIGVKEKYEAAEVWSVSAENRDSTDYAALYALSWLLSEDAQETMYIDNDSYVPLNKNVLDVYINETHKNDSLSYLKDISL